MSAAPFRDAESRVLTPEAFEFVLRNELKRAARSQNFLTLLVMESLPEPVNGERTRIASELARVVSREVRETDLLSQSDEGQLSIVLLDADLPNSMRVVERLLARLEHHDVAAASGVTVGAACCPTHGADLETLRRAAETSTLRSRRESRGQSGAQ